MADRILIIDDEEHIRRMIRLTLEAAGYEVDEASDGAEGIRRYGDGSTWSGVILDQRMPGMDGLETLRLIKERDANARVVMATASSSCRKLFLDHPGPTPLKRLSLERRQSPSDQKTHNQRRRS